MATAMKVPATFPELEKKPPPFSLPLVLIIVCVAVGGAVGVTVNVFTCPVIVITDKTGVGVHVSDDELEVSALEVVGIDDVGEVEEVEVSRVIGTGTY